MAKQKKKKVTKKGFEHSAELYGILCILISILGIGEYGPVGRVIASFALFLVGSLYMVLLAVLFLIGAYLIVKRENPDFFTSKLLGTYIAVLGLLILMHKDFVIQNDGNMIAIFKETINQLVAGFNSIMNKGSLSDVFSVGGGVIGGVFAIIFDKLFSCTGMEIVAWTMVVLGILLFTGFSILDFIQEKYAEEREHHIERKEERKQEKLQKKKDLEEKSSPVIISDGNEEEEIKDNKKVISSISELTNQPAKEVEEEKNPEQSSQVVTVTPSIQKNKTYILPPLDLLDKPKKKNKSTDNSVIEKNITTLEQVLKDFKINGKVVEVHVGPTVVQYELEIASGTRVNKITSINREISLALAKKDVRIEAPIPGKNTVGIEFANDTPSPVSFYEIISSKQMLNAMDKKLMVPLGKSIMGDIGVCEINKMPHLLIAGTTGSGKSVCVNTLISSILFSRKPEEVKLLLIDPKMVELSVYNGIPHLMAPVVTDMKKAAAVLRWAVREMEARYKAFAASGKRDIKSYNEAHPKSAMPLIVLIIDELADLMMTAPDDIEESISRLAQMARAAGIHMVLATQRPSVNVITGSIKANVPSRISFAVGSQIDSRTILDMAGAEKLLGKGDMLFSPIGANKPIRVQGAFISDDEVEHLVEFVKQQREPEYDDTVTAEAEKETAAQDNDEQDIYRDELLERAVNLVMESGQASVSMLQRRFRIGYTRAARLVDTMEDLKIVGPNMGSKAREILMSPEQVKARYFSDSEE